MPLNRIIVMIAPLRIESATPLPFTTRKCAIWTLWRSSLSTKNLVSNNLAAKTNTLRPISLTWLLITKRKPHPLPGGAFFIGTSYQSNACISLFSLLCTYKTVQSSCACHMTFSHAKFSRADTQC